MRCSERLSTKAAELSGKTAASSGCETTETLRPVAAIHDHDGFPIGRDAYKDGLMSGYGAREDGVRLSVNRKKRVVPGSGGEDAIAIQ